MRHRHIPLLACLLLLAAFPLAAQEPATREHPNVILIYADDLGIGLLGCYGQQVIATPNIDRLAAEGIRFTNYYGGTYCAPSRWSVATGMHDGRVGGWAQSRAGLIMRRDQGTITEDQFQSQWANTIANARPIHPNEVFLGQVAQQAGYHTAQFGKLDSGFLTNADRVRRFGWDTHLGYYDHQRAHGFYPRYLWHNGDELPLPGNTRGDAGKMSEQGDEPVGSGGETYSQTVFIEHILQYLRDHRDERFFLYHPTQLPHGPVAIPAIHPDYADRDTTEGWSLAEMKYASMVRMLDDHVGLILDELDALGLDETTLVLFVSDNGHELYYGPKRTYPQRIGPDGQPTNLTDRKWRTSWVGDRFDGAGGRAGIKRSGYQGGVQLPLLARWPGTIAPGQTSDLLAAQYDLLPTLADLTGGTTPAGKDGISFLPTLLGQPQDHTHDYVVINNGFTGPHLSRACLIAADGYKLVELDRDANRFQLYDLNTDNAEEHDLSTAQPERVEAMRETLLRELGSPRPDLEALDPPPAPDRR